LAEAGERKKFFFEKKNQKTFGLVVRVAETAGDSTKKFFCFFFSKKKRLPLFLCHYSLDSDH
jgi:hypothetical protein